MTRTTPTKTAPTAILPARAARLTCQHCSQVGTTAHGGLWRTGQGASLYYLHSDCLLPYKRAHRLQSVEGRVPVR